MININQIFAVSSSKKSIPTKNYFIINDNDIIRKNRNNKSLSLLERYYLSENLSDLDFDTPSEDEIKRGIVINAPGHWGQFIRETRSLKILLLGGSNTANGIYYDIMSNEIEGRIKNKYINKDSYIINNGISGHDYVDNFHRKFDFELKPIREWPNIIMLEYTGI